MKNYYTIAIVILVFLALFLGGLIIFQKKQSSQEKKLLQSSLQENVEDVPSETKDILGDSSQKEFTISVGENTKIFGIDPDNPYIGEPPAAIGIGAGGIEPSVSPKSFEIWGDVISVDPNEMTIRISSDSPRPISTAFTPRGPKVSLQDIKKGDRVVASSEYNESGEPDYSSIQFIQITPSLE